MHQDNCGYLCMIIQPALKEDAGWYTVSAKNDAGIVSSTARLDVHGTFKLLSQSNSIRVAFTDPPCIYCYHFILFCPQLSGSSQTAPSPRRCVPPPAATPRWRSEGWMWRRPSFPTPARCSPVAWWKVTTCREAHGPRPPPPSCPRFQHSWHTLKNNRLKPR